jgi:N-acetylglucosamine kinase-like BadF-type ATPase
MTQPILAHLGVSAPPELVAEVGTASKSRIASLAPIVIRVAERGDAAAEEIVERAVEALLLHVRVAMGRETSPGGVGVRSSVVLWGGLVAAGGSLRRRILTALKAEEFDVIDRVLDPPMGAARLALSLRS